VLLCPKVVLQTFFVMPEPQNVLVGYTDSLKFSIGFKNVSKEDNFDRLNVKLSEIPNGAMNMCHSKSFTKEHIESSQLMLILSALKLL